MTPLNLRDAPPRGPRERAGGVMMLARTIDKARAFLPGGDLGCYFLTPGLSEWLLGRLKLSEAEFIEIVRAAEDDAAVVAALGDRIPPERCERLNAFLENLSVAQTPPELHDQFVALYGPDVPGEMLVIDAIANDDRVMFSR